MRSARQLNRNATPESPRHTYPAHRSRATDVTLEALLAFGAVCPLISFVLCACRGLTWPNLDIQYIYQITFGRNIDLECMHVLYSFMTLFGQGAGKVRDVRMYLGCGEDLGKTTKSTNSY